MKDEVIADEKSDGLDIVSIGKLYEGPLEKKYWSSSRGKDRYPYPVGYVANRVNNGNKYEMSILEGRKGPEFVISSTDGQSCSGQTPDIAWEGFQKKSSVRVKFMRGKRFSCKIDGAEFFGFKNPHVMRLLRGLKANVSPIAEKTLPSFPFDNGQSEGTHEQDNKHPDSHVNLVKIRGKERKSNKRKETHVKSVGGPGPKRERPQDFTQSVHEPHCRQGIEGNHNNGILPSSSILNGDNVSHLLSAEEGMLVDPLISSDHLEKEKCLSVQEASNSIGFEDLIITKGVEPLKTQENHRNASSQHDSSMFNRTPGFTSSKPIDEEGDPPLQKESQMLDDVDLYAPDTLDLTLDSTWNLEVQNPKESTCTLNEKLNSTKFIDPEKCLTVSHSRDETVNIEHSEKSDSDPAGQEISNSMMELLLPRALPLLKTFSRKKKKDPSRMLQKEGKEASKYLKDEESPAKSSEHLEKLSDEVHIPDRPSIENFTSEKQKESDLFPSTRTDSAVHALEDSTAVAPDSFENDQNEIMDCSKKADQNTFSTDLCTHEGLHEETEVTVDHVAQKGIIGFTEGVDSVPPHQDVDDLISVLQGQRISQDDTTKMVHNDAEAKVVVNDELDNVFELVGCYMFPTPISMAMLRTKGNEVFVCVLCGYLMENERKLFVYKASIKGETRGCPYFIGHTTIIASTSGNASGRQIILDRSSLQFTPDGKSLVLLNNIKAPYCSKGSVNCGCSVCASDCFENNAVKIVQAKFGYVEVVCKLKTFDNVFSILVCEPSYLIASEESGKMNLWTMNSSWSASTEQSYLPLSNCMPNCIVEMKRIPNFPALIVGHSAFGDFCLWDLKRRTLVSKFSAPATSLLPFIPISLLTYPTQPLPTSEATRKKQVEDIMEESQKWVLDTDNHNSLPINEEHVSLILLVSSVSNLAPFDEHSYKDLGVSPAGSWSLALLAKNKLVLENALDPRATVVGASSGYGIIGTCDGCLYIWELSTGSKLGYLSHCTGATVSCLATDDSESGAFAVAVDDQQLQIYVPGTLAKKIHV